MAQQPESPCKIRKKAHVVGIDPGNKGALALLSAEGVAEVIDMPHPKKGEETLQTLAVLQKLKEWSSEYPVLMVALERVHVIPGDGVKSSTTFMQHYGRLQAVGAVFSDQNDLSYVEVPPRTWQARRIDAKDRSKTNDKPSMRAVQQKFPEAANLIVGPKGGAKDGRSDAIMIADWAHEQIFNF